MSLLPLLPVEAHEVAELVLPMWAFPAIATAIFALLGIITWSYRDVYHRHNDRTAGDAGSHQDAHH